MSELPSPFLTFFLSEMCFGYIFPLTLIWALLVLLPPEGAPSAAMLSHLEADRRQWSSQHTKLCMLTDWWFCSILAILYQRIRNSGCAPGVHSSVSSLWRGWRRLCKRHFIIGRSLTPECHSLNTKTRHSSQTVPRAQHSSKFWPYPKFSSYIIPGYSI